MSKPISYFIQEIMEKMKKKGIKLPDDQKFFYMVSKACEDDSDNICLNYNATLESVLKYLKEGENSHRVYL